MLHELTQDEQLERRDLARLQPPQQLLLPLARNRGDLAAASARNGSLQLREWVGNSGHWHAVDSGAVGALHVLQRARLRCGEDALAIVAADLGAAPKGALSLRTNQRAQQIRQSRLDASGCILLYP